MHRVRHAESDSCWWLHDRIIYRYVMKFNIWCIWLSHSFCNHSLSWFARRCDVVAPCQCVVLIMTCHYPQMLLLERFCQSWRGTIGRSSTKAGASSGYPAGIVLSLSQWLRKMLWRESSCPRGSCLGWIQGNRSTRSSQQRNNSSFSVSQHLQCQCSLTPDRTIIGFRTDLFAHRHIIFSCKHRNVVLCNKAPPAVVCTSVMLCLWRYVSVLCRCFHLLRSTFMWRLECLSSARQPGVALRYHVLLLSVMTRYDRKIMHRDRSKLTITCPHVPLLCS